jgi:hypothetical protein
MAKGHPLDDADREYRRVLGLRIAKAAELAGLKATPLAELTRQPVANMFQYMKGTRNVAPEVIGKIAEVTGVSVEDLFAGEDAPMTVQGPQGRCPAGFVVEAATPRLRVTILLICDRRRHDDQEDHHDPRGLAWRSAPGI